MKDYSSLTAEEKKQGWITTITIIAMMATIGAMIAAFQGAHYMGEMKGLEEGKELGQGQVLNDFGMYAIACQRDMHKPEKECSAVVQAYFAVHKNYPFFNLK